MQEAFLFSVWTLAVLLCGLYVGTRISAGRTMFPTVKELTGGDQLKPGDDEDATEPPPIEFKL